MLYATFPFDGKGGKVFINTHESILFIILTLSDRENMSNNKSIVRWERGNYYDLRPHYAQSTRSGSKKVS